MKKPSEIIFGVAISNQKHTKEVAEKAYQQIDQIIIWIVGFSTAAIPLLISFVFDHAYVFSISIVKTIIIYGFQVRTTHRKENFHHAAFPGNPDLFIHIL